MEPASPEASARRPTPAAPRKQLPASAGNMIYINKNFRREKEILCLVGDGLEAGELLKSALLRQQLLVHNATHGDHGQAAVLDLDELLASHLVALACRVRVYQS
ncbi:MAG: hypothetical protein ACPIOQ_85515, partial [Promethearchaeia archaeon]